MGEGHTAAVEGEEEEDITTIITITVASIITTTMPAMSAARPATSSLSLDGLRINLAPGESCSTLARPRDQIHSDEAAVKAAVAILLCGDKLFETSINQFGHHEDRTEVVEEDLALHSVATERLEFDFIVRCMRFYFLSTKASYQPPPALPAKWAALSVAEPFPTSLMTSR
jgi:hypothetical protein